MTATALIAEDEPLLAAALQAELASAWPDLRVLASVGDGLSAVRQALALQPDVLFFDIRMPGLDGFEAAAELADRWPDASPQSKPFPALVFITAYDQYAVQAFEAQAVDYLLKPVQAGRLRKTAARLQDVLARRGAASAMDFDDTLARLRKLLEAGAAASGGSSGSTAGGATAAAAPLRTLQVSVGNSIRMVPIDDILYFEAADKYVRVLTPQHEYLIRTPIKELLPQLSPDAFWQIHRGTVVRTDAIESVVRDDSGRLSLHLRGRPDKLAVSRLYAHLFKAL
ncbi:MAG: LytTR family DNA-binding domain-containing protein [Burkholderiaceae bacterium]|nr:LytTR family DNA-binding domain-containing protein [Burkholderiaceae bacterium]MDO9090308.1 LytTR family DNA-binding domain-containing protein [Burkholderiaceae bacterium]MDP1968482.1 LytTR family DNA-binding domain-containing protein [Burkholderiaceae bacterium]